MPTTLRLAGLNDIDLALVAEAEQRAHAANVAAMLEFFPWLGVGTNYARHGGAETALGKLYGVQSELYNGGVSLNERLDIGAAIFNKLAARQRQRAAGFDLEASRSETVLRAADAYFDLVNFTAELDIAEDAVRVSQDYEDQLTRAYQAGLTNRSEVLRVGVQTQRDRITQREAQAAVRSAAAALATLLRLDPAVALEPVDHVVTPATLVPIDSPLQALVSEALTNRPELKASRAAISAADQARRAAKYGPLIPSVTSQAALAQLRGGVYGAPRAEMTAHDYMVGLSWRFGPGGLFDFSRTEAAESAVQSERLNGEKVHDDVAQQVVQTYVAAHAALDQMHLARHAVELAQQSLTLSRQRRQFGVDAVLEVIQAQQDLTRTRADYAQALTLYAKAQYGLARATARIGGG